MKKIAWLTVALLAALCGGASAEIDDSAIKELLDAQYTKLAEAHNRKDEKAIAALKTADFHSIFPDGKIGDVQTMRTYTKRFLENNQPPYTIKVTIQALQVSENKLIAIATVLQEVSRSRLIDGQRRNIGTRVVQDETWSKTPSGWKLKYVANVHDQKNFVDGKRVDPTKPYDPNAPPYLPDSTGAQKP
jgi:hypothetical protein